MYTFDSRIRYSETDRECRLTLESLLDYFQDCSTFHSEDLGVGIEYLNERNLFWVLISWQIIIDRYPKLGEKVTVGTFPYAFKGGFGYRNFCMLDEAGNDIAKANSLWILLEKDILRPGHPTREMLEKYTLEEKLPMEYAGRRIDIPQNGGMKEAITVMPWHLDTNNHVNNGQFVRIAMSVLPKHVSLAQMRAEYKQQAHLDDILHPYVGCRTGDAGQNIWVVSLQDAQGGIYANVEVEEKRCADA
ncbi:MAG: acyl-[acyl-carrier-protein] thioesterase [Lachnospiraceae bacterium]|nr:acyl-[acyl-carrier-protein] thioesterase [Lachnospiraceae bacterium]